MSAITGAYQKREFALGRSTSKGCNRLRFLNFFRYISWLLTSTFYLLGAESSFMRYKLVVIICLLISTVFMVYLMKHCKEAVADQFSLVLVDTVGVALFLIPTGGLASPFIWYALNPIFMAALLLPGVYCWGVLLIFLAAASVGSVFYQNATMLKAWQENYWLLLVFLLLTTFAYLFARLISQLSKAYEELSAAYSASEKLLQHNSDLYQALESFSSGENPSHLANLLAEYAKKLTDAPAVICYLTQPNTETTWQASDPIDFQQNILQDQLKIENVLKQISVRPSKYYSFPLKIEGKKAELICLPLQSVGSRFGFLGTLVTDKSVRQEYIKTISFLAELGAIVLERKKADELSSALMISEEQNRIANEIHDGVAQYLFSIVYALHGLSRRTGFLQDTETQEQLNLISNTANKAAKELRASIYSISPRRRGEQVFVAGLASYLAGLAKLNNVTVDLRSEGSEEALSPALRKALYRIVREATSNAIRHGGCRNIQVYLQMEPSKVILEVLDDGQGFEALKTIKGLGLENMNSLMASFKGKFQIQSTLGQGTKVTCVVPED